MHIRQLLVQARLHQHEGDLTTALRCAREALSLRPECSTIHALLGHLYEQSGNASAAHYHFQAALAVKEEPAIDGCAGWTEPPPPTPARPTPGLWLAVVLIGCVLFSGLAVVYSFLPEGRKVTHGAVVQIPPEKRPPLPEEPRWVWTNMPEGVVVEQPGSDQPPAEATTAEGQPPVATPESTAGTNGVRQASAETVLGPSVRPRIVAEPTHPTLEQADQAYFTGQYERAVTVYEEVLQHDNTPNPRLYQDLAWCYQQLGNSTEAAEHLHKAVLGYKALVVSEPQSTVARQGLQSCEAALRTLLSTREHTGSPDEQ
ncbi:MAG: tetratricopeptide repeat protein [Armatimonadota bacterium]